MSSSFSHQNIDKNKNHSDTDKTRESINNVMIMR